MSSRPQPDLFDSPPGRTPPRARRTDPESSHAAADRMEASGTINRHQRWTLEIVTAHPARTSKDLETTPTARKYGLQYHAIARRLGELEAHDLVHRLDRGKRGALWFAGPDRMEASGTINQHQRWTLEIVTAHPARTSKDLETTPTARKYGLQYHAIARRLGELEAHDLVHRLDRGKRGALWFAGPDRRDGK